MVRGNDRSAALPRHCVREHGSTFVAGTSPFSMLHAAFFPPAPRIAVLPPDDHRARALKSRCHLAIGLFSHLCERISRLRERRFYRMTVP